MEFPTLWKALCSNFAPTSEPSLVKVPVKIHISTETNDFKMALESVAAGEIDLVREMLNSGKIKIDQSYPQVPYLTLLRRACHVGERAVIQFLLRKEADPNIFDGEGRNCLNEVLERRRPDLAWLLVDYDCPVLNNSGKIPVVFSAAVCGDLALMKEFVENDPRFSTNPSEKDVIELLFYFLNHPNGSDSIEMLDYIFSLRPEFETQMSKEIQDQIFATFSHIRKPRLVANLYVRISLRNWE